jgi:hypothetical protein
VYDYLSIYYQFNLEECDFEKVKEVLSKYEQYPLEKFRDMFLEIREQIDEIENTGTGPEEESIELNEEAGEQ